MVSNGPFSDHPFNSQVAGRFELYDHILFTALKMTAYYLSVCHLNDYATYGIIFLSAANILLYVTY